LEGLVVKRASGENTKYHPEISDHHTSGLDRIHPFRKAAIVHRELVDLTSVTQRPF